MFFLNRLNGARWNGAAVFALFAVVFSTTLASAEPAGRLLGILEGAGHVCVSADPGAQVELAPKDLQKSCSEELSGTRPLVSGDRVVTGEGTLLADMGGHGTIALMRNGELRIFEHDGPVTVQLLRGRMPFHLASGSQIGMLAGDVFVRGTGEGTADGELEVGEDGKLNILVERGGVDALQAGTSTRIDAGGTLALQLGESIEPAVAAATPAAGSATPWSTPQPISDLISAAQANPKTTAVAAAAVIVIGVVAGSGGGSSDASPSE